MIIDIVPALRRRAGAEGLLALRQGLHARAVRHHARLNALYAADPPEGAVAYHGPEPAADRTGAAP